MTHAVVNCVNKTLSLIFNWNFTIRFKQSLLFIFLEEENLFVYAYAVQAYTSKSYGQWNDSTLEGLNLKT